jgi:hypothetical protein
MSEHLNYAMKKPKISHRYIYFFTLLLMGYGVYVLLKWTPKNCQYTSVQPETVQWEVNMSWPKQLHIRDPTVTFSTAADGSDNALVPSSVKDRLTKHIHMQSTCRICYGRLWLWEDIAEKTEDDKHIMKCRRTGSRKKGRRSIMRRRRGGGGE